MVHLHRLHCAVYAGRVVNWPGAELQTEGSMRTGLGSALFEGLVLDQGQVTNANLSDYNVPTAEDTSAITHELIERAGAPVHGLARLRRSSRCRPSGTRLPSSASSSTSCR